MIGSSLATSFWIALGLLRYGDPAGLGLRGWHWWQRADDWADL
jgi:hypothetical protein